MTQGQQRRMAQRFRPLDFHHDPGSPSVSCAGCGVPLDGQVEETDEAQRPVCSDRCAQLANAALGGAS